MEKLKKPFTLEEYIDIRKGQIEEIVKKIKSIKTNFIDVYNDVSDLYELTWDDLWDSVTDDLDYYDASDIDELEDDPIVEDAHKVSEKFDAVYDKLDAVYEAVGDLGAASNELMNVLRGSEIPKKYSLKLW